MARRTVSTTVHLPPEHDARLRLLAARTGRSVDELLVEATALLLAHHRDLLPEQLTWPIAAAAAPESDR